MDKQPIRFSNTLDKEIASVIRSRVNAYFTDNGIPTTHNGYMLFKSFVMVALYVVPFVLMLTGVVTGPWAVFACWIVMGSGMAGIGFSVMHDANHNAYFKNGRHNRILGYIMYALGGSAMNWKIQHNNLHHGFTNITGADEDIDAGKLLRMSPHQPLLRFHRYQHIYAWFLYSLMTLYWFLGKDIPQLIRYREMGFLPKDKKQFRRLMFNLLATKAAYGAVILGLPLLLVDLPWWQTVVFFTLMQLMAGLLLGLVFQPAHVVPENDFPLPDDNGRIGSNWTIHQLMTTADFAPKSRLFSWYIGGLNYQIEHHLFANICHIHYRKIAPIVRETVLEHGLPYHVNRTFAGAVANHARMLYRLGRHA